MVEYSPRQPDGSIFGHLFACLGGRAMWWNGAAPRFAASDFATWPITLADLEPFYDWAEVDFRVNCDYTPTGLGQMVCRLLREAGLPAELGPYAIDTKPTRNGWIAGTVGNPVASLLRTNHTNNKAGRAAGRRIELRHAGVVGRQRYNSTWSCCHRRSQSQ